MMIGVVSSVCEGRGGGDREVVVHSAASWVKNVIEVKKRKLRNIAGDEFERVVKA